MDSIQLTVFFEDPFWVAIFERRRRKSYQVARHVFGAEPSGPEVYHLVLRSFGSLEFGPPVPLAAAPPERHLNPKRAQREARREMEQPQASTRSQEALRLQLETGKQVGLAVSRQARAEEQQRKFELRQLKRKQKHLGR
jgi:hypothetical protein